MHLYDALEQLKKEGFLRVFDDTLDLTIDDALTMAREADDAQYYVSDCYIFAEPKKPVENVPVFIATRSGCYSDCIKSVSKLGADTICTNGYDIDICDYLAHVISSEHDPRLANRRFRVDADKQIIADVETGEIFAAYKGERIEARKQRKAAASAKTAKKSASSAENGKKGGRPKTNHYYVISKTKVATRLMLFTEKEMVALAQDLSFRAGTTLESVAGIKDIETPDGDFVPEREWKPGEQLEAALDVLRRDGDIWDIYPRTARGIREFRKAAKQISLDLHMRALKFSQ